MRKSDDSSHIRYTLAFCCAGEKVLLLHRKNEPNKNLWNGLGGKIEANETHRENVKRELQEEAGIDVEVTPQDYKGIVEWIWFENGEEHIGGTHLYFFLRQSLSCANQFATPEGRTEWKDLSWILEQENREIVENIPLFFSHAYSSKNPSIYRFVYNDRNTVSSFAIDTFLA